jgi:hypothetical protein
MRRSASIVILLLVLGCDRPKHPNPGLTSATPAAVSKSPQKIPVPLRLGYTVLLDAAGDSESVGYGHPQIMRSGKIIYADPVTDLALGGKKEGYPKVFHFHDHDELLIDYCDAPYPDKVLRLVISHDSVVHTDTLAEVFNKASNLNNDGVPHFAGFMEDVEFLPDSIYYHPILYYAISSDGIVLDSALTRTRNEWIYGRFYGFEENENVTVPNRTHKRRLDNELNRIEKIRPIKLHGF